MTWATRVTILRLLCAPAMAAVLWQYGKSQTAGAEDDRYRIAGFSLFIAAALSDALDGFIARRWRQQSALGKVLDPVADKMVLLVSLLCLTTIPSPQSAPLPVWFLVLVLSRDSFLVGGIAILRLLKREVPIHPHWTGKAATFFSFLTVAAALLKLPWAIAICWISAGFILASACFYCSTGWRILFPSVSCPPLPSSRSGRTSLL
ncbi:Putative CDP-diacylglycerol--glycerol-3-phosphate 3-phosphatidyl-transferase 2 [Methylacidimicrobium cyclopophantes]|uniref:CDP-diacylglycerol--glycerol-3-phosphate 3-phosphatidyltransferase n=1 Tax=Methylacidimicrobium cyclopophantes TaxID=1041766 RepID=A0A5E6M6Q3_9BACT|nr:CDP-alcohol phosphatidyltransferase family protein [Methylacidimicrobium cyclopophantes]VVM04960.1 Putative CDP-diacylglycerol--glycerol-3-phosphate 3-phosphatidyl-transferase 2 [Methylacidimicrobium cyclopophantes]